MADHNAVSPHSVERNRCIDQRLALFGARLRGMHIDHVSAEPFARNFKAQQSAGRILKEGIDNGKASQRLILRFGAAIVLHPLLCLIQQEQNFMPFKLADACQITMRKSQPARRIFTGAGARA